METWVLLRGLTRASAHWAGFDAALQRALPVRVVALDVPGNGVLCDQRSPTTVKDMAAQCRAALQALGVEGPVVVLAISMGGMVAMQWAAQWPQEVSGLVLINTSARPFSPAWQRMRPTGLAQLLRTALRGTGASAWERAILAVTANHAQQDVLAHWCAERQRHPVSLSNVCRQLLAAARYRAPLQAPVPTLVLASVNDRLVNVECSRALAQQWRCALLVHPSAGHDLTLDDASWVLEKLRRWHAGTSAAKG